MNTIKSLKCANTRENVTTLMIVFRCVLENEFYGSETDVSMWADKSNYTA